MSDDISLGDLVCAFRFELRDGLLRIDQLGQTLRDFEATGAGTFANLRNTADIETATLADRVLANLGRMAARAGAFLAATFGVAAIIRAVKGLGEALIEENDAADQFLARLQQVEGDAGRARASLEWLEKFSLTTKAGMADLVDAFVLLKNRGIADVAGTMDGIKVASKAMGRSFSETAQVMTMATMDAGRGLKQYGINMSQTIDKVTFEWTDQNGKLTRTIIKNNDALIVSTLGAIFNSKYATAAGEAVRTWSEMQDAIRKEWGNLLQVVGKGGAWTEVKAQLAGFSAELHMLFADKDAGQQWAKAMGEILTPVAKVFGSLARLTLEAPIAWGAFTIAVKEGGKAVGEIFSELKITVLKTALGIAQALDTLPFTNMGGKIAELRTSISDTYKEMFRAQVQSGIMAGEFGKDAEALALMDAAGDKAAEGLRKAGKAGETEAKPGLNAAEKAANAAAEALDRLKLKYSFVTAAETKAGLAEFEADATAAMAAGIPAEQIVERMRSKAVELEKQAAEYHLPISQALEDIFRALKGGTGAVDSLAFYIRAALPSAAKDAAGTVKLSVTDAGIKIEQETKGAFERILAAMPRMVDPAAAGVGEAVTKGVKEGTAAGITEGSKLINAWAAELRAKGIIVPVGFQVDTGSLQRALQAMGVEIPNLDNTAGRTRP